jgi:hypothetical protein
VLCQRHNLGLEAFFDSPAVIDYLKRTEAGRKTLARLHPIILIAPAQQAYDRLNDVRHHLANQAWNRKKELKSLGKQRSDAKRRERRQKEREEQVRR